MSEHIFSSAERGLRVITADSGPIDDVRKPDCNGNRGEQTCAVVFPCFNEAGRLNVDAFGSFAKQFPNAELVFVNDGSTDTTLEKLAAIRQQAPRSVSVLSLTKNCGKGEAVRTGLSWSASRGFSMVGFWDADLATPLDTIHGFRRVLEGRPQLEVVWGTRLNLLGHDIERNFIRRQIGRGFSTASAISVGVGIRDALCGAKMFRNGRLLNYVIAQAYSSRWIFDVEMLARMRWLCLHEARRPLSELLYEYPLDQWSEIAGSKLRAVDFLRATRELASLFLKYRLRASDGQIRGSSNSQSTGEQASALAEFEIVFDAASYPIVARKAA